MPRVRISGVGGTVEEAELAQALIDNLAFLDRHNEFTKTGTGPGAAAISIAAADPTLYWKDTDESSNDGHWRWNIAGRDFSFDQLTDTGAEQQILMRYSRPLGGGLGTMRWNGSPLLLNGVDVANYLREILAATDAENTNAVTLGTALTTIASITGVNVALGDLGLTLGYARIDKGATSGDTRFVMTQLGGTGLINFSEGNTQIEVQHPDQAASTRWSAFIAGLFTVDTAGTLDLAIRGDSQGSDSTVTGEEGFMRLFMFRK